MSGFLSKPGSGALYDALGVPVRVRAGKADTSGAVAVIEVEFPPGVDFPTHVHRQSDEAFYVLEGEVTAILGDTSEVVRAGSFALAPRGILHGFSNQGAEAAKVLAWQWPAPDVVAFLEGLAELGDNPSMEQIGELMAQADIMPPA